jgi:uncharacterized protein YbjT (DUF2867 family)
MSANETILVTGATGQQGGAVARSLLRQGEKVRALTRTRTKAIALENLGAEVVIGDLTNRGSLDAALYEIKKVFLVVTPFEAGMEAEVQQGFNMVDAAHAAEVDHLVYSSVVSSDKNTGIPHFETKWQIEQHIQKTGIPYTIIRPVFFMENFYSPWFLPSIQQGKLALPFDGNRPLQMISLYDIGEFGAAAFIREQEFLGEVIEIAGDELSFNEAMRLLSKSLGTTIKYEQLPDDAAEQYLGHDFAVMFRWFDKVGYHVDIPAVRQRWKITLTKYQDLIARESVLRCFRKDIAA